MSYILHSFFGYRNAKSIEISHVLSDNSQNTNVFL